MPDTKARWIDAADVARMIRKELKVFGHKFSVKTRRYAGGSSIDVTWLDGPTKKEVEAAVGHFHGATFDGLDDSMNFHDSELDGERVWFGNNFLFLWPKLSPPKPYSVLVAVAGLSTGIVFGTRRYYEARSPEEAEAAALTDAAEATELPLADLRVLHCKELRTGKEA